ncbi:ParB/RepB/Spo0J family partition protein [Rhodospirillum sp. A1_3_36]|uniref:ParB/RepB/Spo0J family partition protein n=1 Tax=Rhodospirillum sp. A1_3_36 TaxID=3391666 RepID=UPI0039A44869
MKAGVLHDVAVSLIIVEDRLRPVDQAWVAMLAENIAQVGLVRQPIEVRQTDKGLVLVAGSHRLEAVVRLGWASLPALVYEDMTDLEAGIAEVDENLVRHELNPLDRAMFMARRKALYEELHPEARAGVAGGKARQGSATEIISFAAETARRVGLTERTIQLAVTIASKLAPDVRAAIAGTVWAKKQSDLLLLAKAPPEAQRAALGLLQAGTEGTVKAALAKAEGRRAADVNPVEASVSRMTREWNRAPAAARRQFVAHLREIGALDDAAQFEKVA